MDLTDELKRALTATDLFLIIYTVPDQDWSYVMFEAGLAGGQDNPDTRIIVFQFGEEIPDTLMGTLSIRYKEEDILRFTEQFHLDHNFFLRLSGPFASDVPKEIIDRRAHQLYSKLKDIISPEDEKSIIRDETAVKNYKELDNRIRALEQAASLKDEEAEISWTTSRKIFIVHGHDDALKNELARFLNTLEFKPIILHEQADRGQTIYGKLKKEMRDVGYAFVLLTPDDIGRQAKKQDELQPRARQNVVFEHGLFVGRLGPQRVCAICRGEIETPSDLHGVAYKFIPPDGALSIIAFELVKELQASGYEVDANLLVKNT